MKIQQLKSVHFKNPVARSSFLLKSLSFSIQHQLNQNKVSWCYIENDNYLLKMFFRSILESLWYLMNYIRFAIPHHNIWCIKFRSKHSSNTILCLLQNLMHQTLCKLFYSSFVITNMTYFLAKFVSALACDKTIFLNCDFIVLHFELSIMSFEFLQPW